MKKLLVLAESDPLGISGIQGDLKIAMGYGVHALGAITCVVCRNLDEYNIKTIPMGEDAVKTQLNSINNVNDLSCIKIGILSGHDNIKDVLEFLNRQAAKVPVIYTPVTKINGSAILSNDSLNYIRQSFLARVDLLVIHRNEAEAISGCTIFDIETTVQAGKIFLSWGCKNVLIVNDSIEKQEATVDILVTSQKDDHMIFPRRTFNKMPAYGSGYAFTTAISCNIALEMPLHEAITQAHAFLASAIDNGNQYDAQHLLLKYTG